MIARATKPGEIAPLLHFKDDAVKYFPCDRGQWVQWLVSAVKSDDVFIAIETKQNKIKSYFVVANTVEPPICDYTNIIYAYCKDPMSVSIFSKLIIEWSLSKNARRVVWWTATDAEPPVAEWKESNRFQRIASVWQHVLEQ